MSENKYISWTDENREEAWDKASDNYNSYQGILSSSASRRTYLDIEPNRSVRPEFTKEDYFRFRNGEDPEGGIKYIIGRCMKAYDGVGIIKNVIDLMGDFASQGISLLHENKNIEKFYQKWWEKVNGHERSERFLNTLYRSGNVIVYKRYGKITLKQQREMSKASIFNDNKKEVIKKEIPFRYDFLNPINVYVNTDKKGIFLGNIRYKLKISDSLRKSFRGSVDGEYMNSLPPEIGKSIKSDGEYIPLPEDRIEVFHYKKDDWQIWANPMIYAILDDITMLEKMKLADMSALDGAISSIRLWRLGNLEHKILPNRAQIDKLRDILASNVGGGTLDLVWGPEIDFVESNSQIHKFLGMEKYNPVLSSIYAGVGIPPTLTGIAGQTGGFTNNFVSLKTLIERLEYGRSLLKAFWQKELEHVQKAMGFPSPAIIHFDHMILSDETAEKNLLLQLADRDIISVETLRNRLGETQVEESRVKNEFKKRKSKKMPVKVDPFHQDPEPEYVKVALNKDTLSIEDVTDYKARTPPVEDQGGLPKQKKKTPNKEGRPKFVKDTNPRKQRTVLPRSKADVASIMLWSAEAQRQISSLLNPMLLDMYKKKNLRELSKGEHEELEAIKYKVLCGIEPFSEITQDVISKAFTSNASIIDFKKLYGDFLNKTKRTPTVEEMRQIYSLAYSLSFL